MEAQLLKAFRICAGKAVSHMGVSQTLRAPLLTPNRIESLEGYLFSETQGPRSFLATAVLAAFGGCHVHLTMAAGNSEEGASYLGFWVRVQGLKSLGVHGTYWAYKWVKYSYNWFISTVNLQVL